MCLFYNQVGLCEHCYGSGLSFRLDTIAVISSHLGSNVRAQLPAAKYASSIPGVRQSFQMSGLIMASSGYKKHIRGWKSMELKFSKLGLAKLPRSDHVDS